MAKWIKVEPATASGSRGAIREDMIAEVKQNMDGTISVRLQGESLFYTVHGSNETIADFGELYEALGLRDQA